MTVVAPHAGAWIETYILTTPPKNPKVAPHAGAWIETFNPRVNVARLRSLPTRERGLKLMPTIEALEINWSLPTRERGLKRLFLNH